jgi:DNA-binding transcriptional LysR family regulator
MNLRQIEVFRAVMVTGSITGAAEMLHVSQPGISRLISHLELRLGLSLFERRKGRLLATPEARALHQEIERVYHGVKRVQETAAELKSGARTVVRILASPSSGLDFVPRAIATLTATFPAARVSLEVLPAREMLKLLLSDGADVAISSVALDHPSLQARTIGKWHMVCVFPKGHPLEAKAKLDLKEALRHPLVSFKPDTPQGRVIDDWFEKLGVERNISIEVMSGQSACALVMSGAGVAFVDDLTVRSWPGGGLGFRAVPRGPSFGIYAVVSRNHAQSELTRQFCELAAESFRQLAR